MACAFFRFLRRRSYGGRKPRPRWRRAGPGWGRAVASGEESRGPWRRPRRTGGLSAPPPHGGLPAPRGPLQRESHPSGPPDRAPGPGRRCGLACPCAAPAGSEPTNFGVGRGGGRYQPRGPPGDRAEVGDPATRLGSAVPPDLPGRPAQAGTDFQAAGTTEGGLGTLLTGKFPGIEGLASGPP